MTSANPTDNYYDPTGADLMRQTFENTAARDVRYTGPVVKGGLATLALHFALGPTLMGIHLLLGLASLAPLLIGLKNARASGQQFRDLYEQSLENPDLWQDYVDPKLLEGEVKVHDKLMPVADLLNMPVKDVIASGLSRGKARVGKRQPRAIKGQNPKAASATPAKNFLKNSLMDAMKSLTEESSGLRTNQPPSVGTPKSEHGALSTLPIKTVTWPDGIHLFMIGLSGSAKTTVLQSITHGMSSPVVYLTIKTDDTAPPEWLALRLEKFANEQLLRQLEIVIELLTTWIRKGVKHRLCIDEYVSIRKLAQKACKTLPAKHPLKGIADQFESLVFVYNTTGRTDGHYLGLLSQSPNGTDNFDSAKEQAGLRIVLCASELSSEKFRHFLSWAKQLFPDLVDPGIAAVLKDKQAGFWHLYADGGALYLNPTEKLSIERVPCQTCPQTLAGMLALIKGESSTKSDEAGKIDTGDGNFAENEGQEKDKIQQPLVEWQINELVQEVIEKLPLSPRELGLTAWASRMERKELITNGRGTESMKAVMIQLQEMYPSFGIDSDGKLTLG